MAWLTASKTAWNLPPISARSRFHPCQYAVEVLGRRCSTQASRTRGVGDLVGPRHAGQLLVEHVGKGEQIVALVPQRDAHRADAPRILRLEALQFIGDEVEQLLPRG